MPTAQIEDLTKLESPLLAKEIMPMAPKPDYTVDEETYIKRWRTRLFNAHMMRDREHDEFDGMDYRTAYQLEERLAGPWIMPKRNKEDTIFQSGIIRQKQFQELSAIIGLNLSGDISAFDNQGLEIQGLGDAMEDVLLKAAELDGDDEKKNLRQFELNKHGTIFVEELWLERTIKNKVMQGKFDGKIKGMTWTTTEKPEFARPTRNIIPGTNVYLGDITKYDISDQPYIFTVDAMPYVEAEATFGSWERWINVPRKFKHFDSMTANTAYDWRLLETRDDYVEILRCQDKWSNEFVIFLNGILMTPVGLPLPWGYRKPEYNIIQQNREPIHTKFAYGRSLTLRLRHKVALYDEMMRLSILKTQKSYMPPRYNISGRIVSNRVFMPGKLNHGIPPGSFPPIEGENQGVNQAEFEMTRQIQESINAEVMASVGDTNTGKRTPLQIEILEMQRQAKLALGHTLFAMTMMEWKLEWLRLQNVLAHWFIKEETLDKVRNVLKETYRTVSTERAIPGEGMGRRIVIPTQNVPSSDVVKQAEDSLSADQGVPVRLIFLNPDEVSSAKLVWQIVIRPKEKKTSEAEKLLFRAFMADAAPLGPDIGYLREKFASVWGDDPKKLFPQGQDGQTSMGSAQGGGVESGIDVSAPKANLPQPARALQRQVASNTIR